MTSPYESLPEFCFWSHAMSDPAPGRIDPVVRGQKLLPTDRVATMGSCFAQHLARHIVKLGLNYFVAEQAPAGMSPQEVTARNFGTFSARYGNVYTVAQANQLFDRAFGGFAPIECVWQRGDGFVDAFRPQIEPGPLATQDIVLENREQHLGHVRQVFIKAQWLVFTLGLTEAWRSKSDGAVYPIAPGTRAGGAFDPLRHEFVNFGIDDVRRDLFAFIDKIAGVNPACRILLTVSPVPLIATYEPRHVWTSTVASKAILRIAAEEAERRYRHVTYFPSYEVITSPAAGGRYYEDDLREVTDLGVQHVMRLFEEHYVTTGNRGHSTADHRMAAAELEERQKGVVCDEEVIVESLAAAGFRSEGSHRLNR